MVERARRHGCTVPQARWRANRQIAYERALLDFLPRCIGVNSPERSDAIPRKAKDWRAKNHETDIASRLANAPPRKARVTLSCRRHAT